MDDQCRFPTVHWASYTVCFEASPLPACAGTASAVVVFAWDGAGWVLGHIEGRGWTVPSGRIEAGESPLEAAIRETQEEVGAELVQPRPIGCYTLAPDIGEPLCVPAFLGLVRSYGEIPPESESRQARAVAPGDLPGVYYAWDPLLAAVFAYAHRCLTQAPGQSEP